MNSVPVSVVLLAHNEVEVIEKVVRDFYEKIVAKIPGSEVIVAEDGSTDGTKEVLRKLEKELPLFRLEEQTERRGYVQAFKDAMALANNEWIVFCDTGNKHDPDDFWKMYDRIKGESADDMVVGYKVKRADPFYRIVLTRVFNFCVNTYFGVSFKDIDCPLRVFRKSAFLDISKDTWIQKDLINFELTLRMISRGYKVSEVPVKHYPRKFGPSRGLPPKKIPKVILRTLGNFPRIKKELTETLRH